MSFPGIDTNTAASFDPSQVSANGLLGGGQLPTIAPWQQGVGLFGAGLKDAGAWLSRRPEDATAVGQYSQQLRQYQAQQAKQSAVAAMTSNDPAVRQKGYTAYMMLGGDPRPFQAMQASKAMPGMLNATQPQEALTDNAAVGVTPQVSATGPAADAQRAAANATNATPATTLVPGSNLMDAMKATGSPELAMQMTPGIIENQMNVANKSLRPASAQQKLAAGYNATDPVMTDIYGNLTSSVKPQAQLNQENYEAANKPITPEEKQTNSIGWANAHKPVAMGLNGLYDPASGKIIGGGTGTGAPAAADPTAPNITGQTGLSPGAFNYLIGNTSALPRDAASRRAIQAEANQYLARSGTDISSIQSQYKAQNNILQNNLQRSNQMGIGENELAGTVQNLGPVADALKGGNLRWVNGAAQFVGGLANDPNAQKYSVYLNQLRTELANYNAVSSGKITENGTPRTDDSDLREAESTIQNGINRGGANGLLQAVQATSAKNRTIVGKATDNANQSIWDLFGVGKNYKARFSGGNAAPGGNPGAPIPQNLPRTAAPAVIRYDASGKRIAQ